MTIEDLRAIAAYPGGWIHPHWLCGWLCGRHERPAKEVRRLWEEAYDRHCAFIRSPEDAALQAAIDVDNALRGER